MVWQKKGIGRGLCENLPYVLGLVQTDMQIKDTCEKFLLESFYEETLHFSPLNNLGFYSIYFVDRTHTF